MHTILAVLRHIHRELYLFGPAIVPAVLGKYRMQCAVLICGMCLCVAIFDLVRRRWIEGALWIIAGGLLWAGFISDMMLWGPHVSAELGLSAIGIAVFAVLLSLWHELQLALVRARRDRHELRRVRPRQS